MALKDHMVPPRGTHDPWPRESPIERTFMPSPIPTPPQNVTAPLGPDPVLRSSNTPLRSAPSDSLNNFYRSGVQTRRSIVL